MLYGRRSAWNRAGTVRLVAVARNNSIPPVSLPLSLFLSLSLSAMRRSGESRFECFPCAERRRAAFSIRVQLEIAVIGLRREFLEVFNGKHALRRLLIGDGGPQP